MKIYKSAEEIVSQYKTSNRISGKAFGSVHTEDWIRENLFRKGNIVLTNVECQTLLGFLHVQHRINGLCTAGDNRLSEVSGVNKRTLQRSIHSIKQKLPRMFSFKYWQDESCVPQYKKRRQVEIRWDDIFIYFDHLKNIGFQMSENITKRHGDGQYRSTSTECSTSTISDSLSSLISFRNNIEAISSKNKNRPIEKERKEMENKKLCDLIEYIEVPSPNKTLFYNNKKDKITFPDIEILINRYHKQPDIDTVEEPSVRQNSDNVIKLESRYQAIPPDIKKWAESKTPEELSGNIFYRHRQWAIIRAQMFSEQKRGEQGRTEPAVQTRSPEIRGPVGGSISNKKQMRLKRIREIPLRYPNYKEILKRERCESLDEMKDRMMANFDYDPFEKDTSRFNCNCYPEYGFMTEEERDVEFVTSVDSWLGKPNNFFRHSERNLKMFKKARVRADSLKAKYGDWVAALYDLFGPTNIFWTHMNYKKGEEVYNRWVKKGKPYPMCLGSLKIQRFYSGRVKGQKKEYKQRVSTFEQSMHSASNIVELMGDSWKTSKVTSDREAPHLRD